MTQHSTSSAFDPGETCIVVVVPEAEPLIGLLRRQYDTSDLDGIPAHVAVLGPWLPEPTITVEALADLARLAAETPGFDAQLHGVGRFPGVVWLRPSPTDAFVRLTQSLWRRWPDFPPYRGQYSDIVPHLTVDDSKPEDQLDVIEHGIGDYAPIPFRVTELALFAFDGSRWRKGHVFPLC